jgi:hypothetical protein
MKNIMNQKLSTNTIRRCLWMGALLLTAAAATAQTPLTFQVDMSNMTIPAGDTVSVNGAFDNWTANHTLTNNPSGTNINLYTGTVANTHLTGGETLDYQYRLVEANGTTIDDYSDQSDGDNYCALIPASGPLALPYQFWDDDGAAVTNSITFSVDMAEQLHLGNLQPTGIVSCLGSFEGWTDANFLLTNNVALNVTNGQGIITSMPFQGTYMVTNSPGAAIEYKFVYNNTAGYPSADDVYEAPLVGDPDNGNNRYLFNEAQTVPIVNFSDLAFSATVTNNVTFVVDMSVQEFIGAFTNGCTVEIHGDYNDWGGGTTMTNNPADPDTNHYYTTIQYIGGLDANVYFKYVIQPGTVWENLPNSSADTIGGNRYDPLVQGNTTLPIVCFNDICTTIDYLQTNASVTFTVDMTAAATAGATYNSGGVFTIGFDDVYLNGIDNGQDGSYWAWSAESAPSAYQMTEVPANSISPIYTITVPVNAGSPLNLVYKYSIDGSDNEAGTGDNHMRYIRSLTNYSMPTDEFGSQGGSTSTEPSFGNLQVNRSGNNVVLAWLGREQVQLQSTANLSNPANWTALPLTDGTNLIVTPGTNLGLAPSAVLTTNVSTNYPTSGSATFYRLVGPQ